MGFDTEGLKELQYRLRLALLEKSIKNEENTKGKLIIPFLRYLGYSDWDIEAEEQVNKSDRIDYKVLIGKKPVAIIECKKLEANLDKYIVQLKRYYQDSETHLAVLTDGNDYLFFTDSKKPNVMDKEPFFKFNLENADDESFTELMSYSKDKILDTFIPYYEAVQERSNKAKADIVAETQKAVDILRDTNRSLEERAHEAEKKLKELQTHKIEAVVFNRVKLIGNKDTSRDGKNISDHWDADNSEIIVPSSVVESILDTLPQQIWNDKSTFLALACKGEFLRAIFDRLMNCESIQSNYSNDIQRISHIISKQLYGVCLSQEALNSAWTYLLRSEGQFYNLIGIEGYKEKFKKNDFGRNKDGSIKTFQQLVDEEFRQMKFDCVVQNPPYNNDLYIPFVERGFELLKDDGCLVAITPAKWQAKGGKANERFRENIVPHMKEIVYYPDAGDVFNIRLQGGVAYYIIDKMNHSSAVVSSKCLRVAPFNNNARNINLAEPIVLDADACRNICYKVGCFNQNFKNFCPKWVAIEDNINIFVTAVNTDGGGKTSFNVFSSSGNLTMLAPFNRTKDTFYRSNDTKCIYSANSMDEADSFESWAGTRFVRFMLLMRYCTYHNNNEYSWRFVPDPGPFNHIFTDEELYKKYNLTPEEINIIESVIKERK